MAVVLPYHVTGPYKAGLVFAATPGIAIQKHLNTRERVRKKSDRLKLIEQGQATTAEQRPYRAYHLDQRAETEYAFYAQDLDAARARARTIADELVVEPTDDLAVLGTFSDEELREQVRFMWPDKRADGLMRARCPSVWQQIYHLRTHVDMNVSSRTLAMYTIRLAMLLPDFGPAAIDNLFGAVTQQASDKKRAQDRERQMLMHRENVGARLVDTALDAGLAPHPEPFTKHQRQTLIAIGRAYGYMEMTWNELTALWSDGPEAVDRTRLRSS